MNKNPIIIINTEKIFTQDRDFYCNNVDMKVLSEGLSEYHELQFIARKSKKKKVIIK